MSFTKIQNEVIANLEARLNVYDIEMKADLLAVVEQWFESSHHETIGQENYLDQLEKRVLREVGKGIDFEKYREIALKGQWSVKTIEDKIQESFRFGRDLGTLRGQIGHWRWMQKEYLKNNKKSFAEYLAKNEVIK